MATQITGVDRDSHNLQPRAEKLTILEQFPFKKKGGETETEHLKVQA